MISVLLLVNDVSAEYQPFVFALYNKKDAPYNALTIEHVWLIVYRLSYRSKVFYSYRDVTIAGDWLQHWNLHSALIALSREESLSCHTCYDTGPRSHGLIRETAPLCRLLRNARDLMINSKYTLIIHYTCSLGLVECMYKRDLNTYSWLIDWIVFYALSAIFQLSNGGKHLYM